MLQVFGLLFLFLSILIATYKTKDLFNPVNILALGFFFHMIIATYKISGLQSNTWTFETKCVLFQTWIFWFLYPLIVILFIKFNKKRPKINFNSVFFIRVLGILTIGFFLYENFIFSRSLLPFLYPYVDVHTSYTPLLSIFTLNMSSVLGVILMLYFKKKNRVIDFILGFANIILPLTRLSRIHFIINIFILVIAYYYFFVKSNKKFFMTLISFGLVLIVFLSFIAIYRGGGNLETYFSSLEFKFSDYKKPLGVFAYYYGYFPLSFENFDGLVRRSTKLGNFKTNGLYSIRPLTLTLFQLDNLIPGYPGLKYYSNLTAPVLQADVIATSLGYFFVDFGAVFIFIPLFMYISIFLFLYIKKGNDIILNFLYSIYASVFMLSGWNDLISIPATYYKMIFITIILCIGAKKIKIRF